MWKDPSLVLAARGTVQKGKRWKAGEKGSHASLLGLYLSPVTQCHLRDSALCMSDTTERALTSSCLILPSNCNQSTERAGKKDMKEANKKWEPFLPDRVLPGPLRKQTGLCSRNYVGGAQVLQWGMQLSSFLRDLGAPGNSSLCVCRWSLPVWDKQKSLLREIEFGLAFTYLACPNRGSIVVF